MHYRQHGLRHVPHRACRARRYQRAKSSWTSPDHEDPRMGHLGRTIEDEYATIRPNYETPKNPIILAHGLLGFEELHLPPKHLLPGIRYWRGIREALTARGIAVFTTSVPASASIEQRAAKLAEDIAQKAGGRSVNIIAHSMG
ncbi:MAG: hypothetical protein M1815_002662 [Lichina confinis]|nr:MAG: hypothetical protein M1815_002662 [Lichina confinis]